jgi:hypothetical protein
VDPALAASLVGDRTGEPADLGGKEDYTYKGCSWEDGSGERTFSVNAKIYNSDATETAEEDYRGLAKVWRCTIRLASGGETSACGYYTGDIDTGVIVRKGAVVVRIGYKSLSVPRQDKARQRQIAQQMVNKALAVL